MNTVLMKRQRKYSLVCEDEHFLTLFAEEVLSRIHEVVKARHLLTVKLSTTSQKEISRERLTQKHVNTANSPPMKGEIIHNVATSATPTR